MTGDTDLAAPGDLELVRRFVNTRDLELGTDTLATPADLDAFFGTSGATAADLERAIAFRESPPPAGWDGVHRMTSK